MTDFHVIARERGIQVEVEAGLDASRFSNPVARILSLDQRELAGISRILFLDWRKLPDGRSCYGYYGSYPETGEQAIVVCRSGHSRSLDVMLHEVGHHVYRKLENVHDPEGPNQSLADRWARYWKRNRLGPPLGRMPNWLSYSGPKEAFAEVYKYERLGKRLDSMVRREFAYLHSQLS